ncbi:MAG: hypothetical protein MUC88_04955 [Planctomycetes bacterium]|jgi:hypothetical protein|nr:hypothetical protein [Planctomycetota bacterium]
MFSDPIVEEIQRIRQEHAQRFNYDLRAIVADLREQEQKHPERLVSLPSKPPRRQRKAL